MTDYTQIRNSLTEQLENTFVPANGLPVATGIQARQWPFYVDSNSHLNFGYGLDITVNGEATAEAVLTDSSVRH